MNKIIILSLLLLLTITITSRALDTINTDSDYDETSTDTTTADSLTVDNNLNRDYQENLRVFYNGSIWIEGEESLWQKTTAYIFPFYTNNYSYAYDITFNSKDYSSRYYTTEFICIHIKNLNYNVLEQEVQLAYRKDNPYHVRFLSKLKLDE